MKTLCILLLYCILASGCITEENYYSTVVYSDTLEESIPFNDTIEIKNIFYDHSYLLLHIIDSNYTTYCYPYTDGKKLYNTLDINDTVQITYTINNKKLLGSTTCKYLILEIEKV